MSFIRQLDTHLKLYACFAVLLCLSTALSLWLLGQAGQMHAVTAAAAHKLSGLRGWTCLCLAAIAAAAALLALWLREEMARPVREAAAMARKVAAGDLSSRMAAGTGGESGALLRTMQEMNDKLVGMIIKVRTGTENIAGGAGEIASGSMDLSARTAEQAVSLEEIASAMERHTATARQNAGRALQAGKLAVSASRVALKGGAVVAEVAHTMAAINDSSRRMAAIVKLIDGIALQANPLALSAAVDEIKRLIDATADQASAAMLLADKAGQTMHDVAASAKRAAAIIGEIANDGGGQAAGLTQVNQAIAAMGQATRHNAGLVAQAAAAAAAMRGQACSLSRATGAFVLGPGHASTAPAIHLVSSNPNKLSKPRPAKLAPMCVVAVRPAVPAAGMRSRGGAASRDLDWEEF